MYQDVSNCIMLYLLTRLHKQHSWYVILLNNLIWFKQIIETVLVYYFERHVVKIMLKNPMSYLPPKFYPNHWSGKKLKLVFCLDYFGQIGNFFFKSFLWIYKISLLVNMFFANWVDINQVISTTHILYYLYSFFLPQYL